MRSHMQRGIDSLRDDHLGLQVLRVIHLIARMAHPARRMHVHHVTHVDDFHQAILFTLCRVGKIVRAGLYAWARRALDFAHADRSSSAPLPTLLCPLSTSEAQQPSPS